MITIRHMPDGPLARSYEATIELRGTVGEPAAPYGAGAGEPHSKGWGSTPDAALRDAYASLGLTAYARKLPPKETPAT